MKGHILATHFEKHVKIWFTQNPDMPLGNAINRDRIIHHCKNFPTHKIAIIYDKERLNPKGKASVEGLEKKFPNLKFIDIKTIEKEIANDPYAQKLFEIIKMECSHENGNLGAASDVARLLKPIIERGAYSDLDNMFVAAPEITGRKKNPDFFVNGSEDHLFPIFKAINNIMLFIDPNHPILNEYRDIVLSNYENKDADSFWKNREELVIREWVITNTGPRVLQACIEHYVDAVNKLQESKLEESEKSPYEKSVEIYLKENNIVYDDYPIETYDFYLTRGNSAFNVCYTQGFDNAWLPTSVRRHIPSADSYNIVLQDKQIVLEQLAAVEQTLEPEKLRNLTDFLEWTKNSVDHIHKEILRLNGINIYPDALHYIKEFISDKKALDIISCLTQFMIPKLIKIRGSKVGQKNLRDEVVRELLKIFPTDILLLTKEPMLKQYKKILTDFFIHIFKDEKEIINDFIKNIFDELPHKIISNYIVFIKRALENEGSFFFNFFNKGSTQYISELKNITTKSSLDNRNMVIEILKTLITAMNDEKHMPNERQKKFYREQFDNGLLALGYEEANFLEEHQLIKPSFELNLKTIKIF